MKLYCLSFIFTFRSNYYNLHGNNLENFMIGVRRKFMINKDSIEKIRKNIENYLKDDKTFNGQLLVSIKGEKVISKGLGMANYEHGVFNTNNTKIRICSITKQFTAALILQLVEKGLLSLDDTLDKYIDDYPKGDKVTIHHLLTHTSGIPDYTESEEEYEKIFKKISHTVEELIKRFKGFAYEFEPGEKFSYSNAGYTLLVYIIEKITNKSYEDNLQENIFNKLSMQDSGTDNNIKIIMGRVNGYCLNEDGIIINSDFSDMSRCYGAGEIYSTIEDLYLWNDALYKEKVISRESLNKMISKQVKMDGDNYYGYGVIVSDTEMGGKSRRLVYHDGSLPGFLTCNSVWDGDIQIIILNNVYNIDYMNEYIDKIEGIIFDEI